MSIKKTEKQFNKVMQMLEDIIADDSVSKEDKQEIADALDEALDNLEKQLDEKEAQKEVAKSS